MSLLGTILGPDVTPPREHREHSLATWSVLTTSSGNGSFSLCLWVPVSLSVSLSSWRSHGSTLQNLEFAHLETAAPGPALGPPRKNIPVQP